MLVPADTGGTVEWVGPREGDEVKKGQLLAKIDVSALKASLDRAKTTFKLADQLFQRRQKLFERTVISKEDLDRSENERSIAYHALRQAQIEHDRGITKSPIDGVVNQCFVDEGEFIDRGRPLVSIVNVDKIKINVNVPELDVRFLKVGRQCMVTIDALPEKKLAGTIDFVAFKADPATKTFWIRVLVDNADHQIRPGMISRVAFLRRIIPDALVAPLFALVDKGGERVIYVEQEGVAQSRTVEIGIIDADKVQITKGLNQGDKLIITGQTVVEDGMKVQTK